MPNSGAKHATLKGAGGGSWGPCTHLVKYGLNVEPRYAKSLAALLRQIEGTLEMGGVVAYAAQTPWMYVGPRNDPRCLAFACAVILTGCNASCRNC